MRALKAALVYFICVFAVGFALGAVRIQLLTPRVGETLAVCLELPVMLFASWLLCDWATRHFSIEPRVGPRLAMGAIAFLLLIVAEFGLSTLVFRRAVSDFLLGFASTAQRLGLAGQILFALFPVIRLFVSPRRK